MKQLFLSCCLAVLTVFNLTAQPKHAPKGSLFIIGGGSRSAALVEEMVKTANLRTKDYMIVLPMSSTEPEASFKAIHDQLAAVSTKQISCLDFTAAKVNDAVWLDSLRNARLIFITGGDQNRFMKIVRNTPVYQAIHDAYQRGATIAGTSAGAAVMSRYMITGEQLLGDTTYHATFDKLKAGNIHFEQGLGLLDSVIIDQHFVKRSRYNRLISALTAHPSYDCIGIDEGTAIIVRQKKVTVAGESQVLRISDPKNLSVNQTQHIKMDGLRFNLYTAGDTFYTR